MINRRVYFYSYSICPRRVVKDLTTEVVVASYNSNNFSIIIFISCYFFSLDFSNSKAEGSAIEINVALPWRYRGAEGAVTERLYRGANGAALPLGFRYNFEA